MPKAKKRSVKARAAKAPAATAPVVAAEPTVIEITPAERKKLVGRIGFRRPGPGMFSEPTLPTVERPSWTKGFTQDTKIPYVTLRCVCNTDTYFELRGTGKAPKPNCCTNAPAYPQEATWQAHLSIPVTELDSAGVRAKINNYDRAVDAIGGRAGSYGGAVPR